MKTMFYLMAMWPVVYEILALTDAVKLQMIKSELKKKPKEEKYNTMQAFVAFSNFFYLIWTFIGIFTFQWPIFLFLLTLGLIPKSSNLFLCRADAFVSLLTLLFILVNGIHLHLAPWL